MFIRSTGLGRTLLSGRIARIVTTDVVPSTLEAAPKGASEPTRLLVEVEITNPVHWTVRAFIDPPDLREMLGIIFTSPSLMLKCLKFLFSSGPKHAEPAQAKTPSADVLPPLAAAPAKAVSGPAPIGPRPIPARKK
ncbi:MAG: hypothetical protein K0B01_10560 [Syntrophobacterales bacterium]|nr:hypothetical protein [Syntrophobacterales bacterium]